MAQGDIISAARYNTIQGRIAALLGVGSGDTGYNNNVTSSPVAVGNNVTIEDMENLKIDYTKIYVHIFGILPTGIIAEDVSTRVKSGETGLVWDDLYVEYETQVTTLENNRFDIDVNYATLEATGVNSNRATVWGGSALPQSVTHEFTATFSSPDALRGFFNAGGEIRFNASVSHSLAPTEPDYQKTQDWQNQLSAMKTIKFGYNYTNSYDLSGTSEDVSDDSITGAGSGTSIGSLNLNSGYQTLFTKTGSAAYTANEYTIQAKLDNSSKIRFLITFKDDANGAGGADERVGGTLTSSITQLRPSGSYVDNAGPSWSNVTTLDANSSVPISSVDSTICIGVCDESSSQSTSGMLSKWTNFRSNYPDRIFYLLQPGGPSRGELREPANVWASDSNATGPVAVNRDDGNVSSASDWFAIANLSSLPSGSTVAISIDNSGSMSTSTVRASYNLFKTNCSAAGITVREFTMSNEDWLTPFDRII